MEPLFHVRKMGRLLRISYSTTELFYTQWVGSDNQKCKKKWTCEEFVICNGKSYICNTLYKLKKEFENVTNSILMLFHDLPIGMNEMLSKMFWLNSSSDIQKKEKVDLTVDT